MNKHTLHLLLLACCLLSGSAIAGWHFPGFVTISSSMVTIDGVDIEQFSLRGSTNVRYNNNTGNAFIKVSPVMGGIEFYGRDANDNIFSCWVNSSDSIYDEVLKIHSSLKVGHTLNVTAYNQPDEFGLIHCNYVGLALDTMYTN